MANNNVQDIYTSEVIGGSREFTAREKLQITDLATSIKLDRVPEDVQIPVLDYAFIKIHNPNAKKDQSTDFEIFCIIADDGSRFTTGSESFISAFMNIWKTLSDTDEKIIVAPVKVASKNREGKYFLTCKLI